MAKLAFENKPTVLRGVLEACFGGDDLRDYLKEYLPEAECDLVIGSSGPNGSFEEYKITIDAVQNSVLMLTLRDFCQKNNIKHSIDIAD